MCVCVCVCAVMDVGLYTSDAEKEIETLQCVPPSRYHCISTLFSFLPLQKGRFSASL